MDQKQRFVILAATGKFTVTDLCLGYGDHQRCARLRECCAAMARAHKPLVYPHAKPQKPKTKV